MRIVSINPDEWNCRVSNGFVASTGRRGFRDDNRLCCDEAAMASSACDRNGFYLLPADETKSSQNNEFHQHRYRQFFQVLTTLSVGLFHPGESGAKFVVNNNAQSMILPSKRHHVSVLCLPQ